MLPDGPKTPRFWQTLSFLRDPYAYSADVLHRYGKVVRVRPLNGDGIVTSEPELIKRIFAADPDGFAAAPVIEDLFGRAAVIATAGATHRRQRKLLNPHFHGARMRSLFEVMHDVTQRTFERFAPIARRHESVPLVEMTQDLMLDVIVETTFGSDEGLDRAHVRAVMKELIDSLVPPLFGAPILRKSWSPLWRRFRAARHAFDALVDQQRSARKGRGESGNDLLGTFLDVRFEDGAEVDAEEIRDQLFTILMAGHETTAVTLAWATFHVLRTPGVLTKLRAALDEEDERDQKATLALPYLQAVCAETLRLEPPVTDIGRLCSKPLELGPFTVPAGEAIYVSIVALHRDEALYPEPERFVPERFLERRFAPWEFIPFGGGQRRCLGAAFAEAELGLALAVLAREWDLVLDERRPERRVRRGITMGPAHGVRVRPLGRRSRADRPSTIA